MKEKEAVISKSKKKQKFQREFEFRSSPKILYNYLSTASGLEEWFADKVIMKDGNFIFQWEGSEAKAKMVHKRENQLVRFKWLDESDESFIEFEVITDDLTNDIGLLVTDFAMPDEIDESERLWDSQIHNLKQIIGS